jgi:hypothetical protein
MGSLVRYACCEKEMMGSIREKMATQESAPRGGKFSAFGSTTAGNGALAYSGPCIGGGDCSTAVTNASWDNAYTFDPFSMGERLGGEPSILVQRTQCTSGSSDG